MSYTVIILSKSAENIIPCLTALRKNEPFCRVVIIDGGIGQQGIDQVRFFDPVTVLPGIKPFNFSRNCNIGISTAVKYHDHAILLNDDALLESRDGFTILHSAMRSNPEFGVICATTDATDQPLQKRRIHNGLREVPWADFVCVIIPASTIRRVGYFFEEGFSLEYGWEARDYCERVKAAKLKVGVHDACFVSHSTLRPSYREDHHADCLVGI